MDFGLSAEQEALRDVARQFVDRHCPPRRAKDWDETNAYPAELFKSMAEMGWFGLPFPAEVGGEGGGPSNWRFSPNSSDEPASTWQCATSAR